MKGAWPALFVAALSLPFVAFWQDYEIARRALLALVAGAGLVVVALRYVPWPGPAAWVGLAFVGYACLGALWATNRTFALDRCAYYAALWGCLLLGSLASRERWLHAIAPASLAVSLLGLAQALGLDWPSGLRIAETPCATLGNLNVASEFVSLGLVALAAARAKGPLAAVTLAVSAAYLVVNGSRSGWLAGAVGLALALAGRGPRRLGLLLAVLGGLALGLGAAALRPAPPRAPESRPQAPTVAQPSTIEVRKQLWLGALDLVRERPVFGQHAGQFAFEYPRVRRDAEIELSSFGRQFRTTVDSAHNDWLELVIEHGIVGLALLLAFGVALRRGVRACGGECIPPLAAFATLMLVRSPLGNAPAAAWVLAFAGSLQPRLVTASWPARVALGLVGGVLVWLGSVGSLAELGLARFVASRVDPVHTSPDRTALEVTLELRPNDPRLLALRGVAMPIPPGLGLGEIPLLRADPYQPAHWWTCAEALANARDPGRALEALARLHELDPRDPEGAMLRAAIAVERGDAQTVLDALCDRPCPKLRRQLATTLAGFAGEAQRRNHPAAAARLEAEAKFVAALDRAVAARDDAQRLDALVAVDEFRRALRGSAGDARGHVLLAALQLARGREDVARSAAELVADKKLVLPRESRALLEEPVVQALRSLPEWRPILNGQ